jgi:hypothetical protein
MKFFEREVMTSVNLPVLIPLIFLFLMPIALTIEDIIKNRD